MLTNLPLAIVNQLNDLPREGLLAILDIIGGDGDGPDAPKRIVALDKGVYQIRHFSFANMLLPVEQGGIVVSAYPFDPWMSQDRDDPDRITKARDEFERMRTEGYPESAYGVCDSPAQLLEKHPILATCAGQHVVSMTHITKNPGERGGWRWHKWGPYIGDDKPQCEYLSDEDGFDDGVWVFHILEIKIPEGWT